MDKEKSSEILVKTKVNIYSLTAINFLEQGGIIELVFVCGKAQTRSVSVYLESQAGVVGT